MATGIAGDSSFPLIGGIPVEDYQLIEMRVISILLQSQNGNNVPDELRILRNDQAFELGLPVPVIGN